MNIIKSIFFSLLVVAVFAACGTTAPENAAANQPKTQEESAKETTAFPVTIEVCGQPVVFDASPERAVTNDVNITEIFLSLGLEDKLVGYSGISTYRQISPEWQGELKEIPQLSPQYIDLETLVGAEPDFFFAGWSYGFSEEKGITPESLEKYGIKSYVLTESCIRIMEREQVSLEDTFTDILNIGRIFGVEERAQALVAQYRAELAEIEDTIGNVDQLQQKSHTKILW